ncbi:MAG: flavin reductase family protein [Proteobacteria bacterium]|nr:flavin reductase family protein [Pseudomonadota bacterium]
MPKTRLGALNSLYPMPTTLVGAMVDGRPNFLAVAHVGIMDHTTVSLGLNKVHYTNAGIKENGTFSVNIPSMDLVEKTDYCGLVSGRNADKASLFDVFYGNLVTAPMIRECPVNMECRLVQALEFPKHDIFIGEVVETWCDDAVLEAGRPDPGKIRPLLFSMHDKRYYALGPVLAEAWSAGQSLKKTAD